MTPEELLRQAGFELLTKVTEDEHGTLYLGRDGRKRPVMIYLPVKPIALDAKVTLGQLEKELKKLKHAALVPALKLIGPSPAGPIVALVSESAGSLALAQRLRTPPPTDLRESVFFVLVLAEALEHAAARLMVHGHLAPERIFIGDDGKPRLLSIDLRKLDGTVGFGEVNGPAQAYAAPELLRTPGARPTVQTDVYSLGVLLYGLLTGDVPEPDPGLKGVVSPRTLAHDVPTDLEAICQKAMAIDPAARYGTMTELAADLRRFLGITKPSLIGWLTRPGPGTPTPVPDERQDFWK